MRTFFLRAAIPALVSLAIVVSQSVYANNDDPFGYNTKEERDDLIRFFEGVDSGMKQDVESMADMVVKNAGPVIGVGIRYKVVEKDGWVAAEVENVVTNTPAEKAGLQKGDFLFSVNGKGYVNVEQLRDEFAKDVRGNGVPGRVIRFTVSRGNEFFSMQMNTAVLREDKTKEANSLRDKILKEGEVFKTKITPFAADLIKALKAGPVSGKDPRLVKFFDARYEYLNWLADRYQEVLNLVDFK